jgi:hypothetical protein
MVAKPAVGIEDNEMAHETDAPTAVLESPEAKLLRIPDLC